MSSAQSSAQKLYKNCRVNFVSFCLSSCGCSAETHIPIDTTALAQLDCFPVNPQSLRFWLGEFSDTSPLPRDDQTAARLLIIHIMARGQRTDLSFLARSPWAQSQLHALGRLACRMARLVPPAPHKQCCAGLSDGDPNLVPQMAKSRSRVITEGAVHVIILCSMFIWA